MAQVYEKTHTLAINLERVTTDHLDLVDLCDSLVSEYIANYPEIELKWLSQMYEKQVWKFSVHCQNDKCNVFAGVIQQGRSPGCQYHDHFD